MEDKYDKDMKLPEGKTCKDCYASYFCIGIGCTYADRAKCDYWPNRFKEKKKETGLDKGLLSNYLI